MAIIEGMSAELIGIIKGGAKANQAEIVEAVLTEGKRWKPVGYDENQKRRRDHYQGRGAYWIRQQLKALFPKTWANIPVASYNWAKMHADISAAVYDDPPQRILLDELGEPLADDDARVSAFARLLADSQIATQMPEAERRLHWTQTVVLSVRWRKVLDEASRQLKGRVCLDLHWPHDVWVVPHPSSPTDVRMALAVMVKISGPSGVAPAESEEWFELWTRESEEDELGNVVAFGPWRVSLVSRGGTSPISVGAEVVYQGSRLPFLFLRLTTPEGSPWVDAGEDDVQLVEMLNVDLSDEAYISHLQGHTDKVYKGTRYEAAQMVGGPDRVLKIDVGEELVTLDYNPKLAELRAANQQRLKMWAMVKRHSQDAYTIDASAPQSGVSRQIANEPQAKMRQEQITKLKAFEEHELLPTILDVYNAFSDEPVIDGVSFKFVAATPTTYEEKEATQRRALEAKDAGLITEARAAVECGWHETIEDAVAAGLSNDARPMSTMAPAGGANGAASRFAARLLAPLADDIGA